jgi:putative transposase
MPRRLRAVAVGYPHHVTQRGNDRRTVFTDTDDYARYRQWLACYAGKYGLDIWAYCLMPNHVHVVAVPTTEGALAMVFNLVHMQYAKYRNGKSRATGHLWQGRYFSCVLDEPHVYAAVRYVELNPVRSGLAGSAGEYAWSSARSHLSGAPDPVLSGSCYLTETIADWQDYLGDDRYRDAQKDVIRATKCGRPCGSEDFLRQLEALTGRRILPLRPGRHRRTGAALPPDPHQQ